MFGLGKRPRIGGRTDGRSTIVSGRGRGRARLGGGAHDVDAHLAEVTRLLDVTTGVGDGARSHGRLALLVLLREARHVEAASQLVGWRPRPHSSSSNHCLLL